MSRDRVSKAGSISLHRLASLRLDWRTRSSRTVATTCLERSCLDPGPADQQHNHISVPARPGNNLLVISDPLHQFKTDTPLFPSDLSLIWPSKIRDFLSELSSYLRCCQRAQVIFWSETGISLSWSRLFCTPHRPPPSIHSFLPPSETKQLGCASNVEVSQNSTPSRQEYLRVTTIHAVYTGHQSDVFGQRLGIFSLSRNLIRSLVTKYASFIQRYISIGRLKYSVPVHSTVRRNRWTQWRLENERVIEAFYWKSV